MWFFDFCNNAVRFQDWILRHNRTIPKKQPSSKGERAVVAALEKHGINYEMQYALGYYVHVDFAIYYNEKMFLVEYDGRQHYHPVKHFGGWPTFILQRIRDITEGWECRSRSIPLLRIRYDLPQEKVEETLLEFIGFTLR